MPHPTPGPASALLLTWLAAPLIAIGIGVFAGVLALAGMLAALPSSIARVRLRPQVRPVLLPVRQQAVPAKLAKSYCAWR